ncbi:MAG: hypothetical protein COA86_10045 [Kangiella sp.]|nr:MAG: hypothetical protein COA86_10045 [Kangiella sp.]
MKTYILLGVVLLTGCSDSYDVADTPVNQAPTITAVGDQSISANQASDNIQVMVSDDSTISQNLLVSIISADQNLIRDEDIQLGTFSGSLANLVITPVTGMIGTAVIAISFTDENNASATSNFNVTVVNQQLSANDFIRSVYANSGNSKPASLDAIVLIQDVDDENQFNDLIDAIR